MQQAIAGNAIHEEHEVGRDEMGFEFMLNALRMTEGFESRLFMERTGLPQQLIEPALQQAEKKGLLEVDFRQIRPTELGQRFLNDLQQMFLPD